MGHIIVRSMAYRRRRRHQHPRPWPTWRRLTLGCAWSSCRRLLDTSSWGHQRWLLAMEDRIWSRNRGAFSLWIRLMIGFLVSMPYPFSGPLYTSNKCATNRCNGLSCTSRKGAANQTRNLIEIIIVRFVNDLVRVCFKFASRVWVLWLQPPTPLEVFSQSLPYRLHLVTSWHFLLSVVSPLTLWHRCKEGCTRVDLRKYRY